MTRFMEDTVSAEVDTQRQAQRIADYIKADPDHVFHNERPFRYIESE